MTAGVLTREINIILMRPEVHRPSGEDKENCSIISINGLRLCIKTAQFRIPKESNILSIPKESAQTESKNKPDKNQIKNCEIRGSEVDSRSLL